MRAFRSNVSQCGQATGQLSMLGSCINGLMHSCQSGALMAMESCQETKGNRGDKGDHYVSQ